MMRRPKYQYHEFILRDYLTAPAHACHMSVTRVISGTTTNASHVA